MVLRLAVVALTTLWPQYQPLDARGFDERAWALVALWRDEITPAQAGLPLGGALPFSVFGSSWTRYDEIVAALYALFGRQTWRVQVFNASIGVLASIQLVLLARLAPAGPSRRAPPYPDDAAGVAEPGGHRRWLGQMPAGWLAGALALGLPSFVYFTALNLKEALVLYATVGAFLWFGRLVRSPSLPAALLLAANVALLAFVRAQAVLLLLPALALGALLAREGMQTALASPARARAVAVTLAAAVAAAALALGLLHASGQLQQVLDNVSLARLTVDRLAQADVASSRIGPAEPFETVEEALVYLPLGLVYFFLAPLPWQIHGPLGTLAVAEMLGWYALLPFTLSGLARGLRARDGLSLALVAFVIVYAVVAALAVGNLGGLYRYRLPVWALMFVWTDAGARAWLAGIGRRATRSAA